MFDLETQALSIVAQLGAVSTLETVAYIDKDNQALRQPATLPAAFLALDSIKTTATKGAGLMPDIAWTVVVRSKGLDGEDGCLPIIDAVIDSLAGFKAGDSSRALALQEVQYFDQRLESVAYTVRFIAKAMGSNQNSMCGR